MKNSSYWYSKFDKLAGLSFKNTLRLHFDSIILYKSNSFSSALALSVIAMEELAKAHILEDMVWHAMTDNAPLDFSWEEVQKSLLSHRDKQKIFSSHLYMTRLVANNGKIPDNRFYDFIQSGRLEILKQKALYVGLSPKNSPSQKLIIEDPLTLPISASKENITILNDYLIDIIVGVVHEFYAFDAESIKAQVNESLLNRLMQGWPYNDRIGKRAIKIHTEMSTG